MRLATRTGGAAAPYASGSGTKYLSFTYVVASGDFTNDLDYASSAALELNGGRITDLAGNAAILTLPQPGTAFPSQVPKTSPSTPPRQRSRSLTGQASLAQ